MKVSNSSFTFRMMITAVVIQPRIFSQSRFANSPVLAFSPVNRMSGHTANPNCIESTTWLATSNCVVLRSPKKPMTHTAGTPLNRRNNKLAGFRHLALRVDSIATAKAELEKRGVAFTEEIRPAAGGGKVLFFEDAEGNLLHFVERPHDFNL